MQIEVLLDKLRGLRLPGVREALAQQLQNPQYSQLSFEERLGLLLDHEVNLRDARRLNRRLADARFREKANLSEVLTGSKRGLERSFLLSLAQCDWLRHYQNIIITGPTGVGKSYLGSALGRCACEAGFCVRYYRTKRLLHEIERSLADGSWGKLLDGLARIPLLILDDWFRDPLTPDQVRHLLEIFDDRWQQGSTLLITQVPIDLWHDNLKDPTLADAILDRLIHNAHRITLSGESQRKLKSRSLAATTIP
jgi:DNA replication protein DnaC